jgi:hypothetical protein
MTRHFTTFIGIDQTGASTAKGQRAKPLPCVLLYGHQKRWILETHNQDDLPLKLLSFNQLEIKRLLHSFSLHEKKTALIVDCVMGLPQATWPSGKSGSPILWELFTQAASCNSYGRDAAEQFFSNLLRASGQKTIPVRECESKAKANSVFLARPYQKNIQCGTYRIWRDLGSEAQVSFDKQKWLQFYNFDSFTDTDQPWFFEGYPSLLWRDLLKARSRNTEELKDRAQQLVGTQIIVSEKSWDLLSKNADYADAAVLAIGAFYLQNKNHLLQAPSKTLSELLAKEGWIMGLPRA